MAEQPPLKLDTSSEVLDPLCLQYVWGWVVGTHIVHLGFEAPQSLWLLCSLTSSQPWHKLQGPQVGDLWDSESMPLPVVSSSFVFFPNPEARVFATFWLDHPTAEGGTGGPEAEETTADAEREKPIAAGRSEQATDAFAQTGTVHPIQP